jgi:hypothetical protein
MCHCNSEECDSDDLALQTALLVIMVSTSWLVVVALGEYAIIDRYSIAHHVGSKRTSCQKKLRLQRFGAVMRSVAAVHSSIMLPSFLQSYIAYAALVKSGSTAKQPCTTQKSSFACVQLLCSNTHTCVHSLQASLQAHVMPFCLLLERCGLRS